MNGLITSVRWRHCALHLIHGSLDPPETPESESTSQTASRSVQPFLHSSRQRVTMLYNGPSLFLLKIAPSHGGSGPLSNTWFLGPTQVRNPNGMSIGSAVFAELTIVIDRPTDRQTTPCVTIGRIYVRSMTAMRPKK